MIKIYITLILLLFSFTTEAQKEDYVWFLGGVPIPNGGSDGMIIDWNHGLTPENKIIALGIDNNNASICDKDGNLLFWSNGCAVINRDQEVMPHGDTLNWDPYREVVGWGDCLRGYPGAQNIKILPDPGDENGFYIFHKARRYFGPSQDITTDLRLSYVDMTLDEGNGDVVFLIQYYMIILWLIII